MMVRPDAVSQTGVLIAGGGLVGTALAIALDKAGIAVTLVEAAVPRVGGSTGRDERNLALARASVNGLDAIGVWAHAAPGATAIRHIRVSHAGQWGATYMDADRHGVDALGWTLPARELGAALLRRLDACTGLTHLAPARVEALEPGPGGWRVRIAAGGGERWIDTALLVGADGSDSLVREQLGVGVDRTDYAQSLFVSTVTPGRAHAGRAFERFSNEGPVALLPLAGDRCGLVLTVPDARADAVSALTDADFMALAQQRFGWTLGRLRRPGRRHVYHIRGCSAQRLCARHAVLVGNAAQTVHPIGAQGFNLGLRDALTLSEMLVAAGDPGDAELPTRYAARRAPDRRAVMAMSHALVRLTCRERTVLAPLWSLALLACDRLMPLQSRLARRGMGFCAQPPHVMLERLP